MRRITKTERTSVKAKKNAHISNAKGGSCLLLIPNPFQVLEMHLRKSYESIIRLDIQRFIIMLATQIGARKNELFDLGEIQ